MNYHSSSLVLKMPAANICPLCNDYLVRPVITACGHIFCYLCAHSKMATHAPCVTCDKLLPGPPMETRLLQDIVSLSIPNIDKVYKARLQYAASINYGWRTIPLGMCKVSEALFKLTNIGGCTRVGIIGYMTGAEYNKNDVWPIAKVKSELDCYIYGKGYGYRNMVNLVIDDGSSVMATKAIVDIFDNITKGKSMSFRAKECAPVSMARLMIAFYRNMKTNDDEDIVGTMPFNVVPDLTLNEPYKIEDELSNFIFSNNSEYRGCKFIDGRDWAIPQEINNYFWLYVNYSKLPIDKNTNAITLNKELANLLKLDAIEVSQDAIVRAVATLVNQHIKDEDEGGKDDDDDEDDDEDEDEDDK